MNAPTFDVFRGSESDPLWVECVEGLAAAVDRMKVLAAEKPGAYFVFNVVSKEVLASIDTKTLLRQTARS